MKLEQSFSVQAPLPEVWSALIDVERVAPCLPGAEITERGEDGEYQGTFSVKLGPATASYAGTLKLESADEDARVATMSAKGKDKRGQGGASATIVSALHEDGDATRVDVSTDFTITGRMASFGRGGMIEDISKRLLQDFAECLQATLAGTPAEVAGAEPAVAQAAEGGGPAAAEPSEEALADAAVASAGAAVSEAAVAATPPPEAESPTDEPVAPAEAPPEEPEPAATGAEAEPAEPAEPRTGSVPPPSSPRVQAAMPPPPARPAKPVSGSSLFLAVVRGWFRRLFRRG